MGRKPGGTRIAVSARALHRLAPPALLMACVVLACLVLAWVPAAHAQVQDSQEYLKRMDSDGDGRVSRDEYVAWMSYAFDQRDADHDGVLQGEELPGRRGKPITRTAQRASLIERFARQDANGDGYLSARELLAPPR
ncbi:Ca2+-binding EF-hand superfamily protein [Xanthomonas campestris]